MGIVAFNGLIIPVMSLSAGWLTSILIISFIGFVTYYTAALIITHLGIAKAMKGSILAHFNNNYSYMRTYGFINWFSFIPIIFLLYNFVVLEIQGIIGDKS